MSDSYRITIPPLGEEKIWQEGIRVYCDFSSVSTEFFVQMDSRNPFPFSAFRSKTVQEPFKVVRIKNPTLAPITVNLIIGDDLIEDKSVPVTGAIVIANSTTIRTVVDNPCAVLTKVLLLPADPARKEAVITNNIGNTLPIRVGDVNTAVNQGKEVDIGSSITITSQAAIYAFNTDAVNIANISIMEVLV